MEPTQTNSLPPIGNRRKKIVVTIALLILLLIVGVGSYYLGKQSIPEEQSPQIITPTPTNAPTSAVTPTTTSMTIPADWKKYTNTKYGFSVMYPPTGEWGETQEDGTLKNVQSANVIVGNQYGEALETANSVMFDLDAPISGFPLFYISILNDPANTEQAPQVYNQISKQSLEKILALQVGESLDSAATEELNGDWNLPSAYTRLPDVQVNGINALVIENPKAQGGRDRRLFIKRHGKILMTGTTYTEEKDLKQFEQFYTSLKFSN